MSAVDPAQLAQITANLKNQLAVLTRRDAAITKHLRNDDGRNEQDSADRANYIEQDEVLEALDDQARAEIKAIQQALARIEAGIYGTCASCGRDIGAKRLEALPYTQVCVDCAE